MKTNKITLNEFSEKVRVRTIIHDINVTLDLNDIKFGYSKYLKLNLGFFNLAGYNDTNDIDESFQLILDRKHKKFTRVRK